MAMAFDCKFIETSSVLKHNVDELLVGMTKQIILRQAQDLGGSRGKVIDKYIFYLNQSFSSLLKVKENRYSSFKTLMRAKAALMSMFRKSSSKDLQSCDYLHVL